MIFLTGLVLISTLAALPDVYSREQQEKTNVILIMADDIGYECYGSYGGTSYKTPVLDRMAEKGMKFEYSFSNPICTPTRVKLMTGLRNVRNYAAFGILRKSEKTIGHMMQEGGYRTAIAGKWQLFGADHYPDQFRAKGSLPEDMGFGRHCLWQVKTLGSRFWGPTVTIDGKDTEFGEDIYGPDVYTGFLIDRMEEYRDQPFFLYYPMALVHSPFVPTPDSRDKTNANKQENFADMVAYMDKLIGKIVSKTEELGIAHKTLILVTGDNGTHTAIKSRVGDKVIVGGKGQSNDRGTKVALIAYLPGTIDPGSVCGDLVEFSDFMPTIADAAGVSPMSPTDGVSFYPQLTGRGGSPRQSIYVYYWPRPEKGAPVSFTRTKEWKLYQDGRFFNLNRDNEETTPLPPSSAPEVHKLLTKEFKRMPSTGQVILQLDD